MSLPKNLNLVAAEKPVGSDPVVKRREKVIARIDEQLVLLRRELATDEGGQSQPSRLSSSKRIRKWWWLDANGHYLVELKYGNKALEIMKGRTAVQCATKADIANSLETLKGVVMSGEMDGALLAASAKIRDNFNKA